MHFLSYHLNIDQNIGYLKYSSNPESLSMYLCKSALFVFWFYDFGLSDLENKILHQSGYDLLIKHIRYMDH